MRFGYYETFALELAVDLVNTRSEPSGEDGLTGAGELAGFLAGRGDLTSLAGNPAMPADVDLDAVTAMYREALSRWTPTDADARAVQDLRAELRTVFETAADDASGVVATLNEQLRVHRALPRISDQHGPPHLHFEAAEDGPVHWLAVTALMGLVLFICDGNARRLGICASASCRRAFIDRSKNGSKSYCSDTCSHRESVAAYRLRRSGSTR
ncbi:CGNR zinc finger domain-containing protein [Kribbella sp. NBC_00709]|uniref:CGNR zinc finger domain-containing protein n=1 Tax=Kribbella sp. NBC_00709 TaxID=2975972 RepID=UPI002E2C33DC|nr:CGNR zinc finger domain-containing protein [Kribbella sp. NBC_00709]